MKLHLVVLVLLVTTATAIPSFFRKNNLLPDGKIIGGSNIDISDVPWQVSLQYFGSHICGGSLIKSDYVVTAAHCTDGFSYSSLSVRTGSSIRGQGGQVSEVLQIHQHPEYNPQTVDFDVSVLKIQSSVLGVLVSLPPSGHRWAAGTVALVTGWGLTKENDPKSLAANLKKVEVQIKDESSCYHAYSSFTITDRMFCASSPSKDSCQGDSGGPLVVRSVLAGIVSWGYGCARPEYPGVYTNVPVFLKFIAEKAEIDL